MAKDESKKEPETVLPGDDGEWLPDLRQARIGKTAEKILLSYAGKKPGNFLSVEFAQEVRNVALTLHGEPVAVDPLSAANAAPETEAKPEAEEKGEGELDLDAG